MTEDQKDFKRKTPGQPEKFNIYQKLNNVREAVAYLKKDTKVTGYQAITHDYVTSEIRPHLIKHGIITIPRQKSYEIRDTGKTTKSGVPFIAYIGMYDVDFVNADNPDDKVTATVGAMSEDTADKGPGGSLSYAVKSAFLKVFNIETGEDEESRQEQKPAFINKNQITVLNDLIPETGTDLEKFHRYLNVKSVDMILTTNYSKALSGLQKKRAAMRQPGDES